MLNDVGNRTYDFDHILAGPAGVMWINTKQRQYRLDVQDGSRVVLTERYDEQRTWSGDTLIRQAKARRLHPEAAHRTPGRPAPNLGAAGHRLVG